MNVQHRERRADEKEKEYGIDGGIEKERGVGTKIDIQGKKEIYKSDDEKTKVTAHGTWERVVDGPKRGDRDYRGGVRFSHKW